MLSKLKTLELDKSKLINLYFAIAKAFDDKKKYIESYKYLKLGNDERKVLNTNNEHILLMIPIPLSTQPFHYPERLLPGRWSNHALFFI